MSLGDGDGQLTVNLDAEIDSGDISGRSSQDTRKTIGFLSTARFTCRREKIFETGAMDRVGYRVDLD